MVDIESLARIQFASNISFHILFPSITIALSWLLVFFILAHGRTGDDKWFAAYRFWVKPFALTFALGVVSGVVMSFQFGANWAGYMEVVGPIAGPLLAYEVLTAFFLEAAFLGVMLFGRDKVPGWLHGLAAVVVACGTLISAFWIVVLNSWMQTPQGFEIRDGVAHAVDWWAIVFNPSAPYRLAHVLLASGLTAAFLVAGVSAYRWLRRDRGAEVRAALKTAVTLAAVLTPVQIFAGDLHGLNTLDHQPQKVAAMEGNWETRAHAPLVLFGVPDEESRETKFAIEIPSAASLILKHDPAGVVPGLNDYAGARPPAAPVFFAFRVMVGVGVLMLLVSWWAAHGLWRKGGLSAWRGRALVAMTFSGWVATLAGWYVSEIGRQPWLVTGVLKTAEAVSPIPPAHVALSLSGYLTLYAALLAAYVATLFRLARKAGGGLQPHNAAPAPAQ